MGLARAALRSCRRWFGGGCAWGMVTLMFSGVVGPPALAKEPAVRVEERFDTHWLFWRGDATGAEHAEFDDSKWRALDLPHDWSIEDLPPRTNTEPTLAVTPGMWKFSAGDAAAWSAPELDDVGWRSVQLPCALSTLGCTNPPEFAWFRRTVIIPAELRGRDFLLSIGVVDDADETFFNGQRIGGIGGMPPHFNGDDQPWTQQRVYRVPASLAREGTNVVAVRVFNNIGDGGIMQSLPNFDVVGPFSPDSAGGPATGHTVGGIGWYRKHFTLGRESAGRLVSIVFDGVYMDSDVWLNGHVLGNHPYGYTAFAYDLTPFLKPAGEENILSVRVSNVGKTSRWYSGSGLYRHVTLVETGPLHLTQWGVFVSTPQVTWERATVQLVARVENSNAQETPVSVLVRLLGPTGRVLGKGSVLARVSSQGRVDMPMTLDVESPPLWSPDAPQLCRAEIEVYGGDRLADRTVVPFGIRTIHFSVEQGFTLNGAAMKLRGGCLHHDNGPLGAAALDRAEERRVELLKTQGYNAIRCAHNPPSSAFLNACDQIGMLVLDEAFDCWEKGKNPDDYSRYFAAWWKRDLDAMILRDRNHPSVILWSIGNEIPQRADERGYVVAKDLCDETRRLDPTRPVTEAICNFWDQPGRPWSDTAKAFSFLDVGGYNYEAWKYESDHKLFPPRLMVGTESYPGAIGEYWRIVERNSYVLGDFVWTAMDYLGESGCGHAVLDNESSTFSNDWPWFNAFCGDLDVCGFKKPQSYYRDVVWGRSRLEMMVHRPLPPGRSERVSGWGWPDEMPNWTWPGAEGSVMQVTVYSSCDKVRLELNGKVIGTQASGSNNNFKAHFDLPYEAGELRAVGLADGRAVATSILHTARPAARIRLVADRETIRAERDDLAYVTVEITDDRGNLLPDAAVPVRFSVTGAGELAAVGSGSPNKPESFRGPVRTTFHGRALVILRPNGRPGKIILRAESAQLAASGITIHARQ